MNFLTFGLSTQCKEELHDNQDKFGAIVVKNPAGKNVLVAAVADGITMCYKGEVAAYNTVRFILNWSAEYFSKRNFDPYVIPEEFDKLILKINQSLNNYARTNNKRKPEDGYSPYSSCTLCCAITDGSTILFFGIGDSSIYELKAYTTTNIMGGKKHSSSSGKLTSYVGGIDDDKLEIRFIESRYDATAVYLLCSDGMSNRIIFDLEKSEDFRRFNQRLLEVDSKNNGVNILKGMTEYVVSKGETDDIAALVFKTVG